MGGQGEVEERQVFRSGCRRSGPPPHPPTCCTAPASACGWPPACLYVEPLPALTFQLSLIFCSCLCLRVAFACRLAVLSVHTAPQRSHIYRVLLAPAGFPGGSAGKESACNAGDQGLIPGLGRSPGEGNGNPFQYPCLENPMDRGAWWAIVHQATKIQT